MSNSIAPKVAPLSRRHILIVTGPAGCGKSTVAKNFADRYGFVYVEGDDVSLVDIFQP